ncbi:BQ2448_1468 [Microbotryum intermedium]|uniref:BQ2448_1468 protein n=1 Tax=Microbotryum intermedium TaxID=269621 RepID=A0A238FDW1_9BASI|nr:BQ2448_1468 [Microbotryum intermedium]
MSQDTPADPSEHVPSSSSSSSSVSSPFLLPSSTLPSLSKPTYDIPVAAISPICPTDADDRTETEADTDSLCSSRDLSQSLQQTPVDQVREIALGRLSDQTYEHLLPRWRDGLRKGLVGNLKREMDTLVWIQTSLRTPARDDYFVKTSLLGTHSFFMICVPMPFWFGHGSVGRGLLYVLAAGGYTTSVLKDLLCVPRPYSPPLVRLSVGTHALEYGFPSTHSTTTVSMALYFAGLLWHSGFENSLLNLVGYAILSIICVSVVFGRLYTGMHSITDVTVGSLMGLLCWLWYYLYETTIEAFTLQPGPLVPLIIIPSTLLLVFVHPAPAEDCPCFEDAVAFVSVAAGLVLGHHFYPRELVGDTLKWGVDEGRGEVVVQLVWAVTVVVKLILGVLTIFTWRLVAKEACHAILPPLFRFFSSFLLPRRHYHDATEYDAYEKTDGLHPVPSIIDLPSLNELDPTTSTSLSSSSSSSSKNQANQLRSRSGNSSAALLVDEHDPLGLLRKKQKGKEMKNDILGEDGYGYDKLSKSRSKKDGDHVRRDADVLTKVFVYSGIGWFATIGIPWAFESVGLTVPPPV